MLINKLYTVEDIARGGDSKFTVTVKIDPGHDLFKGHFPEQAILPGVCLMEMVREIVTEIKQNPVSLAQAQNVKFLNIVNPLKDTVLKFEIEILEKDDALQTNATSFLMDGTPNFKIKAKYITGNK